TFFRLKERTLIASVLSQDPLGDGLGAFKASARIEEGALLAAVKIGFALRALTVELNLEGHDRAAHSTTEHLMKTGHRSGTEFLWALGLWSVFGFFWLVSVHVTALPIFPFHDGLLICEPQITKAKRERN